MLVGLLLEATSTLVEHLYARQKSARLKNLTVSSHVGRLLAAPSNVRLRWINKKGTTPLAYQKMELASNVKTFLHKILA
jgi:hypothetical protein